MIRAILAAITSVSDAITYRERGRRLRFWIKTGKELHEAKLDLLMRESDGSLSGVMLSELQRNIERLTEAECLCRPGKGSDPRGDGDPGE